MGYKICCISDTHNRHEELEMPSADLLVVAGDMTNWGLPHELTAFNDWMGTIKHLYKNIVLIAGNHDKSFQKKTDDHSRKLMTNAIYLEEESVEIDGYKIFGSPYQPWYGGWAFNAHRGPDIQQYWDNIPKDVDILITHGPPMGILDQPSDMEGKLQEHVGCANLRATLSTLTNVKSHIFGHIHASHGVDVKDGITYVNASSTLHSSVKVFQPIIIELD